MASAFAATAASGTFHSSARGYLSYLHGTFGIATSLPPPLLLPESSNPSNWLSAEAHARYTPAEAVYTAAIITNTAAQDSVASRMRPVVYVEKVPAKLLEALVIPNKMPVYL